MACPKDLRSPVRPRRRRTLKPDVEQACVWLPPGVWPGTSKAFENKKAANRCLIIEAMLLLAARPQATQATVLSVGGHPLNTQYSDNAHITPSLCALLLT